jgi:hypothetical protein
VWEPGELLSVLALTPAERLQAATDLAGTVAGVGADVAAALPAALVARLAAPGAGRDR